MKRAMKLKAQKRRQECMNLERVGFKCFLPLVNYGAVTNLVIR